MDGGAMTTWVFGSRLALLRFLIMSVVDWEDPFLVVRRLAGLYIGLSGHMG